MDRPFRFRLPAAEGGDQDIRSPRVHHKPEMADRASMGTPRAARAWFLAIRPKTLPAAVVPVGVGTVLAWRFDGEQWIPALICLAFALLIQIGTNLANDLFDCLRGADTPERVGPPRAVSAGWIGPGQMKSAVAGVFAAAFGVGFLLVHYGGWWLLPVGVACILCGLVYTAGPYPLAYHGWGDVFVLVFFGWVAVGFTFFVQTGFWVREVWAAGAAVGSLAVALLIINNLRDRRTDRTAGKRTLAVRFGERFSRIEFLCCHLAAMSVPVLFWWWGWGWPLLLPLVLLPSALRLNRGLQRARTGEEFNRLLGLSGAYQVVWGALFSLGLVLA